MNKVTDILGFHPTARTCVMLVFARDTSDISDLLVLLFT